MSSPYDIFIKILIDDDKIILCKQERFWRMTIYEKQKLIRKSFPRSVLGPMNLFGFKRRIEYKLEPSYRIYRMGFDLYIYQFVNGNNWEEAPFMAFWLYEKHKIPYIAVSAGNL